MVSHLNKDNKEKYKFMEMIEPGLCTEVHKVQKIKEEQIFKAIKIIKLNENKDKLEDEDSL